MCLFALCYFCNNFDIISADDLFLMSAFEGVLQEMQIIVVVTTQSNIIKVSPTHGTQSLCLFQLV